jgi:hypothetical protein
MIKGFLRPTRSTNPLVSVVADKGRRHTDELNEDPYDHDLPSSRDTVDHQSGVSSETEILVDCRTKVVAIGQLG